MPRRSSRDRIIALVIADLRARREKAGMSMNLLAAKSGLSLTMISFVERGLRNPTLDTLLRMAEALGVSLGPLLGRAERAARSE